jgi:hypothetical protein
MALPSNASTINISDKIADTIKTTAGYFTNGDGTIGGVDIHTGSLVDSNEKYYFNVTQMHPNSSSAEVQFSVTYGDYRGSGSNTFGDSTTNSNTLNGETEAVYKQFTNLLLEESEASGGFKISQQGSDGQLGTGVKDDYVYVLVGKRAKFKDRINKKAWTLVLSGSNTHPGSGVQISLTDDSSTTAATATPGGPRHNIISGALGTVVSASSERTFGWFYPEMGVMVFSGAELSASIPGGHNFSPYYQSESIANVVHLPVTASLNSAIISSSADVNLTGSFSVGDFVEITTGSLDVSLRTQILSMGGLGTGAVGGQNFFITCSENWTGTAVNSSVTMSLGVKISTITSSFSTNADVIASSSGFAPNLNNKGNPQNALRFVNCMRNVSGTSLRLRSEEDQTQENYFCRIKAPEYNFSSNPTYTSGSKNKIKNIDMHGNPQTFITGIGLYNSAGQLLAIAKLSSPLKKNFASEATIKVKLTY